MKRLRYIFILLTMIIGMAVTVSAYDAALPATKVSKSTMYEIDTGDTLSSDTLASDPLYAFPADTAYGSAFLKNSKAKIDFAVAGNDAELYFFAGIQDANALYNYIYIPLNEINSAPDSVAMVNISFDLASTGLPVGDYEVIYGIVDENDTEYYKYHAFDISIVDTAVPLQKVYFYKFNADNSLVSITEDTICPDAMMEYGLLYVPENATGYREVMYTGSDPNIFTVETYAGYAYVTAVGPGTATLTATVNGSITASMKITVAHDYKSKVVAAATCISTGTAENTCTVCKDTYNSELPIDPDAHAFGQNELTVITEATACKPGEGTQHCDLCKKDISIVIPSIFTDVSATKYYVDAVDYFYAQKIINGITDTTFGPNTQLTRCMLITMVYRMEGSPACTAEIPFTDVPANKYYADAVAWAYANEITEGVTPTTFAPNAEITREQLATFLYRYAKYKNVDVTGSADLSIFPDFGNLHEYAEIPTAWAVEAGIITGSSNHGVIYLEPRSSATRAQAVTMLYRYLKYATES